MDKNKLRLGTIVLAVLVAFSTYFLPITRTSYGFNGKTTDTMVSNWVTPINFIPLILLVAIVVLAAYEKHNGASVIIFLNILLSALFLMPDGYRVIVGAYFVIILEEICLGIFGILQLKASKKPSESIKSNEADNAAALLKYKSLLDAGVITEQEFETKKRELLDL